MKDIKYVGNNPNSGVIIDWNFVEKEYNRIIKEVVPDEDARKLFSWQFKKPATKWSLTMSERAIGKTSKMLIIGCILHFHFGLKIEYIRNNEQQIKPSNAGKMWDTLLEFNYISTITHGEFNNIVYSYKGWYFQKVDENGKEIVRDTTELCHMHYLGNAENLKSSYVSPRGDWIIYDEFIPMDGYTSENMFIELCQLISTIVRMRKTHHILCLSNNVNPNCHIFHELGVAKDIRAIKRGERMIVKNTEGMSITVEWESLDSKVSDNKRNILLETFNFKNPKLASITGGDNWECKNYKHLPKIDHNVLIAPMRIYVKFYEDILQLKICKSDKLRDYVLVHKATEGIKNSDNKYIVYTNTDIEDKHYFYGLQLDVGKYILNSYRSQQMYFAHNDDGQLFEEFLKDCKIISRLEY